MNIIDGRATRDALIPALKEKISALSPRPRLAIVQVGNRDDSNAYIRAKKLFAERVGVEVVLKQFPETIHQQELVAHIQGLNGSKDIQGIILQLPLPQSIDRIAAIESIDPTKDVDAITSANVKNWSEGRGIMPATARGIKELLDHNEIRINGKNVVVVGRSELVGTPIAVMCRNEGANVTVCHSKTPDLKAETKKADILIVAIGKPRLIDVEYVKSGQVVIDVGISRLSEEGSVGDVDFEAVKGAVAAITPVPGGVGPMTVLALFENLADISVR